VDWTREIDLYCERIGPGLWAEPLNFLTNIAFVGAAFLAYRDASRLNAAQKQPAAVLMVLLAAIGVGSALFHSFATTWAQALDVLPIQLYIVATLYLWLRDAELLSLLGCCGAIFGLLTLSAFFALFVPPESVNGSQGYFGVLLFMGWLAWRQHRTPAGGREFLWATLAFALSLSFRMMDLEICPSWPLGTHFLWHLCNAWVCYLPLRAYVRLRGQVRMA
jgi:hypothetical protein